MTTAEATAQLFIIAATLAGVVYLLGSWMFSI